MMFYTLMMKSMDGNNRRLDFNKYKGRLQKVFPNMQEEELEKHFHNLVEYWRIFVDNIDDIKIL